MQKKDLDEMVLVHEFCEFDSSIQRQAHPSNIIIIHHQAKSQNPGMSLKEDLNTKAPFYFATLKPSQHQITNFYVALPENQKYSSHSSKYPDHWISHFL